MTSLFTRDPYLNLKWYQPDSLCLINDEDEDNFSLVASRMKSIFAKHVTFASINVTQLHCGCSLRLTVLKLTAVCPVDQVLSDTMTGALSDYGPRSNHPTLLTDSLAWIPVDSITADVVPTRLLTGCEVGCWVPFTAQ